MHLVTDYVALEESTLDLGNYPTEGWVVNADVLWPDYWEKAKDQWGRPTADMIAEAQQLMADAGYPNGIKNVDFLVRKAETMMIWSGVFQAMIKEHLNIETTMRTQPSAVSFEDMHSGNFDLGSNYTSLNFPIPQSYWSMLFGSGGSQNFSKWSNAEFDAIMRQIMAESDVAKVKLLVDQGVEILDQEVPLINFVGASSQFGVSERLKGLDRLLIRSSYEGLRFDHVWLDK